MNFYAILLFVAASICGCRSVLSDSNSKDVIVQAKDRKEIGILFTPVGSLNEVCSSSCTINPFQIENAAERHKACTSTGILWQISPDWEKRIILSLIRNRPVIYDVGDRAVFSEEFLLQEADRLVAAINKDGKENKEKCNAKSFLRDINNARTIDYATALYATNTDEIIKGSKKVYQICSAYYWSLFSLVVFPDRVPEDAFNQCKEKYGEKKCYKGPCINITEKVILSRSAESEEEPTFVPKDDDVRPWLRSTEAYIEVKSGKIVNILGQEVKQK